MILFNNRYEKRMEFFQSKNIDEDNTNLIRLLELQRLYAPIMFADWRILHNKSDVPIIENDLGYIPSIDYFTGNPGYGIPLNKYAILLITRGYRSNKAYVPISYKDSEWVTVGIKHNTLDEKEVLSLNRLIMLNSINEFYGPTSKSVDYVTLIGKETPIVEHGIGPELLLPQNEPDFLRSHEMDLFKVLSIIVKPPTTDMRWVDWDD